MSATSVVQSRCLLVRQRSPVLAYLVCIAAALRSLAAAQNAQGRPLLTRSRQSSPGEAIAAHFWRLPLRAQDSVQAKTSSMQFAMPVLSSGAYIMIAMLDAAWMWEDARETNRGRLASNTFERPGVRGAWMAEANEPRV